MDLVLVNSHDEKRSSMTFFPWLRQDDDEIKPI